LTPLDLVIGKLEAAGCKPKKMGLGMYDSTCPLHKGSRRNLSVSVGDNGSVILCCHHADDNGNGSCLGPDIVRSLGLKMSDLYPSNGETSSLEPKKPKAAWKSPDAAVEFVASKEQPRPVTTQLHDYPDADGVPYMVVGRIDRADGTKTFRPVHLQPDGSWVIGDPAGKLPLYGLPRIAGANIVVVTEGERCADAVMRHKWPWCSATTSAHGAKSASKTDWAPLAGKKVAILPDYDAEGEGYCAAVTEILKQLSPQPTIKVVRLPGLSDGEDFVEWSARAGDTVAQEQELKRLIKEAAYVDLSEPAKVEPTKSEPVADAGSEPGDGEKAPKPTQAQILLELADNAGVELWHTGGGDSSYATLKIGNHVEHHPVKSAGLRLWLTREYRSKCDSPPSKDALQSAIAALEAEALFDGEEHDVFIRCAEREGKYYIDLCDSDWRAVEIDADGWKVVENPPVRFRRPKGLLALPEPQRGGSLESLRKHVTVTGADFQLFTAWLTASMRPIGPYPVMAIVGLQGSAKSTQARLARKLIDPHMSPLRCEPKGDQNLMISATNAWVVAFDNISHIPPWLSDGLCRLATGGGFATRTLYENSEETFLDATRPVILNGISDFASRGDLVDRTIFLHLPTIAETERKPESKFWAAFEVDYPLILGALFDAIARALRFLPDVKLTRLPRMADFATWGHAVCKALDWNPDEFDAAYAANRKDASSTILEDSPLADPIRRLLDRSSRRIFDLSAVIYRS
jgi:hypothetical protein